LFQITFSSVPLPCPPQNAQLELTGGVSIVPPPFFPEPPLCPRIGWFRWWILFVLMSLPLEVSFFALPLEFLSQRPCLALVFFLPLLSKVYAVLGFAALYGFPLFQIPLECNVVILSFRLPNALPPSDFQFFLAPYGISRLFP